MGSVRLSGDARRMLIGVLPKSPGGTKTDKDKEKDKTQPLSYAVIEVANGKRLDLLSLRP